MPTSTIETHRNLLPPSSTSNLREPGYEFRKFAAHAWELISELDVTPPDHDRLALIVSAAVEVRNLFFVAAIDEPTPGELEVVVEDFIRRALLPNGGVQ
jgi:hypothetical protein